MIVVAPPPATNPAWTRAVTMTASTTTSSASSHPTLSYNLDHKALQQQWGQPALPPLPVYQRLNKLKLAHKTPVARHRKRSGGVDSRSSLGTKRGSHDHVAESKWTADGSVGRQDGQYTIVNVKERSRSASSSETSSPNDETERSKIVRVDAPLTSPPITPPSPTSSTRTLARGCRQVSRGFPAPCPPSPKASPTFRPYGWRSTTVPLPTPPLSGDASHEAKRRCTSRLFAIEDDETPVVTSDRCKQPLRELLREVKKESYFGEETVASTSSRAIKNTWERLEDAQWPITVPTPDRDDDDEFFCLPRHARPRPIEPLPRHVEVNASLHASFVDQAYVSYITMIRTSAFKAFVRGDHTPREDDGQTCTSVQLSLASAFPSHSTYKPEPRPRSDCDLLRKLVLETNEFRLGSIAYVRARYNKQPACRAKCGLSGRERWVGKSESDLVSELKGVHNVEHVEEDWKTGLRPSAKASLAAHQSARRRQL